MRVMGAGVELSYVERGSGPAVVLVHGMAADASAWSLDGLPGRAIAYDRRGYGASDAPDPYVRTTVNEQAEDLADVVRGLEVSPAVLVGADVGALAVLDVLLRHRSLARAAVLVDPPLFQFVPDATEALSTERAELEEALRAGGPVAAMRAWADAHGGGEGTGGQALADGDGAARAFFADFGAVSSLELTRGDLRGLDLPVGVVVSEGAPRHVEEAAEALLRLTPGARRFSAVGEAVGSFS